MNFLDCNVLHDFHDILDKQVFKCQKGYSRFASETATEGALLKKLFLNISQYSTLKPATLLRILTGKEHRHRKLQRLQKVQIWVFRLLVHQIKFLYEVFKLKLNFQKNKVVTGKTLFFVIGSFCSHHSICLNIGFWHGTFVWKWCVFNLSAFN